MVLKDHQPLVTATVYLFGHELDPDVVSETLGILPSRFQKRGGLKAGSARHFATTGMWSLSVDSYSLETTEMIDKLLMKLNNLQMRMDQIQGVQDAQLDLLVALDEGDARKKTIRFLLSHCQLRRVNELGLSVCVTIL